MAGAAWVASASVRGRLYRIDWYPGVVLDEAAGEIRGEIYDVSDAQFEALSAYEGEEYRCVEVEAVGRQPVDETFYVKLWEWKGTVDQERLIAHGDWLVAARRIHPVCIVLGWFLLGLNGIGLLVGPSWLLSFSGIHKVGLYFAVYSLPLCATLCSWLSGWRHEISPRWPRRLLVASVVLFAANAFAIAWLFE